MGNVKIYSGDVAPLATLTDGDWETALPRTNMQNTQLHKVARTTGVTNANTEVFLEFAVPTLVSAVIVGATNLTVAARYRIRTFDDAVESTELTDTAWITPMTGETALDDAQRGLWIVHQFASPVDMQFSIIEFDDTANGDGYVQLGRLFLPQQSWQSSVNYLQGSNGLGFRDNSLHQQSLSGSKLSAARVNPRTFSFGFDYLGEAEAFGAVYQLMRDAGYAGEVFVLPDPDETDYVTLLRRSFLGQINQMDALSQAVAGYAAAGFEIEEKI